MSTHLVGVKSGSWRIEDRIFTGHLTVVDCGSVCELRLTDGSTCAAAQRMLYISGLSLGHICLLQIVCRKLRASCALLVTGASCLRCALFGLASAWRAWSPPPTAAATSSSEWWMPRPSGTPFLAWAFRSATTPSTSTWPFRTGRSTFKAQQTVWPQLPPPLSMTSA